MIPRKTLPRLLIAATLLLGSRLTAEDRVITASDLPRLARRIELPAGELTVKVWAPARQVWSTEQHGATVFLKSRVDGEDASPAWQSLGTVRVEEGKPLVIQIAGLQEPDKGAGKKGETPASVAVPPVLVLSSRADFDPSKALDVIRGRLDSTGPAPDSRRTQVRTNQQGADFHAPATAQAWRERARAVRQQMLVTLGLWPMPPRTPLNPRVYGKIERDGYTIEKVVLETLPGFTLAGNLYRPAKAEGKLPALLCPHGHWSDGRVNPEVQQRCIRWAKLGCVVFMYDMVGYNDSKPFGHAFLNPRLDRWGYSLATLQTWNSIRALDWITSLPEVDSDRIGCTGESGGGTQTFLLTAIDPRVKIAAPVVMVSDSFQGGCVCENAAGLRHGTDNVEFAALCAPRPLKLVGATGDWTAKTLTNAYPAIRGVYELIGRPDDVTAEVFDFPHNYNQTSRNAVYAFMAPWLLGIDDPEATREGDQTTEKPEDLWAFGQDHPAPETAATPEQLENELIAMLAEQLESLSPSGATAAEWQSAREFLMTSLRVRVGIQGPPLPELTSGQVRHSEREAFTVTHSLVGLKSSEDRIPVVTLSPPKPSGRVTVVFSPHGKAGLVSAGGSPRELVRLLLERGHKVVGFDPLLVGESLDPSAFATRRPDTAHYETYNKTLAADRLQDLATVLAWARSEPGTRQVNLVGEGRWGPLALLARPALEGLGRTVINLHEFDYGDGSDVPEELHLPGALQFGGPTVAAALCAPAPLWIHRTGDDFDGSWAASAYDAADSAALLRIDGERVGNEALARWIDAGE
jgi:dienelactone hydrolase